MVGATVTTLLVLVLEAPFGVSGTTGPDGLPDDLTRIDVVGTTGVVDRCASELDSGSKTFADCTCDLQLNNCDPNCCCDPDCTAGHKAAFTGCKTDPQSSHRRCVYSALVASSNTQQRTEEEADGLFCVYNDNNEKRSSYDTVCTAVTSDEFAELLEDSEVATGRLTSYAPGVNGLPVHSSRKCTQNAGGATACTSSGGTQTTGYIVGDALLTGFPNAFVERTGGAAAAPTHRRRHARQVATAGPTVASGHTSAPSAPPTDDFTTVYSNFVYGVLPLPRALASAECSDTSTAGFMQDEHQTCSRTFTTGAAACTAGSFADVTAYLSPNVHLFADKTSSTVVEVRCDGFTYNGDTTSTAGLSVADARASCVTGARFACDDTATPSAMTKAVTEVNLVVKYGAGTDGANRIASVAVAFVVADVVIPSTAAVFSVVQRHSIRFLTNTSTYTGVANAVPNDYPRSGNPGYIIGKPVLAGIATNAVPAGTTTVEMSEDPLQWLGLPKPGPSARCEDVHPTQRSAVRFGYDMASDCLLDVGLEDFTDCNVLRASVQAIFAQHITRASMIGKYGNSSQLAVNDWVPLVNAGVPAQSGATDTVQSQCTQVMSSAHLELLTARVGDFSNPQNTIVGARYSFEYSTQQFDCIGSYCDGDVAAANRMQLLQLHFSVGFVDVSQGTEKVVKTMPDVIDKLPPAFFYPFE